MWLLIFIFGCVVVLALVSLTGFMVWRLAPETSRREAVRAELPWALKGLAVPFLIWTLMNFGLSFELQPFMPAVQKAQNSGTGWFFTFLGVAAIGWALIASYWAAITTIWALARAGRAVTKEARSDLRSLALTCLVVTAVPVAWLIWVGGWFALGAAALLLTLPIAGYSGSILTPPKPRPMYSRAIARMKFGKYSEAEWEIIRQLENAETDFNGWLMLADLYANQFKDLAEAEQIILEICDQPETTPSQLAVAMHKLADWQLAVANDPEAATRALQVISIRLPNTHLARMAQMRSAQLPRSTRELQEQRQPRHIPLPALSDPLSAPPPAADAAVDSDQALELVHRLTEQLTQNPDHVGDREKLARLLAEPLAKPDLAIEQLDLLLGLPDQPDAKRAEWLGLVATWQVQLQQDEAAARKTLERLVREFPNSPQAFTAQRRLNLLRAEEAARRK
jgi:hypothetical protein